MTHPNFGSVFVPRNTYPLQSLDEIIDAIVELSAIQFQTPRFLGTSVRIHPFDDVRHGER